MERSEEVINRWGALLSSNPERFQDVSGTVKVTVTGVGEWRFRFGNTPAFIKGDGKADCSILMTPSVVSILNNPEVNPQELFLKGDILITGDPLLAMYMNQFFEGVV